MRLFADSSALAKRYLPEPGRETVLARCAAADEMIISFLSGDHRQWAAARAMGLTVEEVLP